MMEDFNPYVINNVYMDKGCDKGVYTTYLLKGYVHRVTLHFSNMRSEDDKEGHINQNVKISGFIHEFNTHSSLITDKPAYLIAPQITFWNMFKNAKIDIRTHIRNKDSVYLEFKVISSKRYELVKIKVVTEVKV